MEWGIELWPSVNGKAIMNGVRLEALSASDLVDVLHYLFEEDNTYTSVEHMDSKSEMRRSIYQNMYGETYKYGVSSKKAAGSPTAGYTQNFDVGPAVNDLTPFNPKKAPKPYIKPTPFDPDSASPFGPLLTPPLQ